MKKEKIFEGIKDLIITLSSNNFSNDIVRKKWLEKESKIQNAIKEISVEDQKWIEVNYKKWYVDNIASKMNAETLRMANKSLWFF